MGYVQAKLSDKKFDSLKMLAVKKRMSIQDLIEGMVDQILLDSESAELKRIAGYEDDDINRFATFMANAPEPMRRAVRGIIEGWEEMAGKSRRGVAAG